ncbi:hypothetical protein Tsubulata_002167 [Turnera subulata]|uniref:Glycoside hydrolase family 5 domain-containing protein n=1 Tax=Turnera subulata TaxID=218843 RepID=A0A9Q0J8J8_9ROSI|nr:hypothetical protein Tsubulata_002167 [Turnera subulata]
MFRPILFLLFILVCKNIPSSHSLPLSTHKSWIVDETGRRVKLTCANWPSHVDTMLAEGLDKQPLPVLASEAVAQKFNCIRLTWATYMWTRPSYGSLTVEESFRRHNLTKAIAGITKHNPYLLHMTLVQAYDTVVDVLGAYGLMLLLDNHVSYPTWCCGYDDGNGFFGDKYFNAEEWQLGLRTIARRYRGKTQVIAIGMRNELRGPRENLNDWYRYVPEAAKQIHEANPDVLVFMSGIGYATDLSYLKDRPLGFNLDNKLVFETHLYAFTAAPDSHWVQRPVNEVCYTRIKALEDKLAFVTKGDNPTPLVLTEVGVNQQHFSPAHDRFLSCFQAYIAQRDLDWGLWAFQGGYYIRENQIGTDEEFGVLDISWNRIRNPTIQNRLEFAKRQSQDPDSITSAAYVLYHPLTGTCVRTNSKNRIYAGSCRAWSRWYHDADEAPIRLMYTNVCIKAVGDGLPPILSTECLIPQSSWKLTSNSSHHLAARDEKGEQLCLHMDPNNEIVTRKCICVGDDPKCLDDPTTQWFQLALRNV